MLALGRGLAHGQYRRAGGDRVTNTDDGFLRDARMPDADGRKNCRADEGEAEADPVDNRRMRIAAADRQQNRDCGPERRDLRQ